MTDVNETNPESPYEAGMTIKFGAGFDAPWWTPRVSGNTPDEVAKGSVAMLKAFVDNGGPEALAQVAAKVQSLYTPASGNSGRGGAAAPKTFQGGRVQPKGDAPEGDSCPHGRTLREGQGQKGSWAAMFCNAPKGSQCDPLWKDQKTGEFR